MTTTERIEGVTTEKLRQYSLSLRDNRRELNGEHRDLSAQIARLERATKDKYSELTVVDGNLKENSEMQTFVDDELMRRGCMPAGGRSL